MWGLENINDRPSSLSQISEINDLPEAGPRTVVSHISTCSYGIPAEHPFDPTKHKLEDKYPHPATGRWMARNQMHWLLRRVSCYQLFPKLFPSVIP